ncbi:hypothetical protein [Neptuniibacter sp.]|uniref:MuF-C-terminal domain-containing protein n=1 Tax=Neptuniibacter sp. TaxID=1962643 RepID=UPI00261B0F9D|nr:hypothetical protein [Neptuniibacter sp.]MCP4597193.1 hypothetical protein [Neptuniibacter sp.]
MNNYSSLVSILLKDEALGNPQHERVLQLGPTPEYLVTHAGFPALDIAIQAKVIGKAHFDHGIKASLIQRLPEILATPKSVFRSANVHQVDSVVVLTYEVKGVAPIIVPIRKNRQVGRGQYFNLVGSIYAKEGPDPSVKWARQGLKII